MLMTGILLSTLVCGGGCAAINSAIGGNNSETGEAWWVKSKGFFGMVWGAKVYYCPMPANPGPAQCREAKMVDTTNVK
jgi:hypothetical protein